MKACIACAHFWIDPGFGGSELTGGDPPEMRCAMNRFYSFPVDDDMPTNLLSAAAACPSFEVSPLAKSKGWTE